MLGLLRNVSVTSLRDRLGGRLEVPGLVVAVLLLHLLHLPDRQFHNSGVVLAGDQTDLVFVCEHGVCLVGVEKERG